MPGNLLLFGGSGAIGSAIANKFRGEGWKVCAVAQSAQPDAEYPIFSWQKSRRSIPSEIKSFGPFNAICWAQGVNLNDSIYQFNEVAHLQVYEGNVLYILRTLCQLIQHNLLSHPARLCIISSIWQNISRQQKLSYGISKAALHGLVLSLANDMARDGDLVNAILPGALDTPMTRVNLSENQIATIEHSTAFERLAKLEDVANSTYYLCSSENTGVTGQFIKVDLGFSDVRNF
jgi:3-oxoacyl-[acyl-carrier protein] reductase